MRMRYVVEFEVDEDQEGPEELSALKENLDVAVEGVTGGYAETSLEKA